MALFLPLKTDGCSDPFSAPLFFLQQAQISVFSQLRINVEILLLCQNSVLPWLTWLEVGKEFYSWSHRRWVCMLFTIQKVQKHASKLHLGVGERINGVHVSCDGLLTWQRLHSLPSPIVCWDGLEQRYKAQSRKHNGWMEYPVLFPPSHTLYGTFQTFLWWETELMYMHL